MAINDAKRADKPDVLIVNGTFGFEEDILAGIKTVVDGVPVIGGSAAGDLATRGWWVASAHKDRVSVGNDAVSVVMMWTSVHIATVFSSCYEPTACKGIVTKKAHGRSSRLMTNLQVLCIESGCKQQRTLQQARVRSSKAAWRNYAR